MKFYSLNKKIKNIKENIEKKYSKQLKKKIQMLINYAIKLMS